MNRMGQNLGRRAEVQSAVNNLVREALTWALNHQELWESTKCCQITCTCKTAQESTIKSLRRFVVESVPHGARALASWPQ